MILEPGWVLFSSVSSSTAGENFQIYGAQITGECIYEIFETVLSLNCKTIWLKTFDLVINLWLISYKVPNLYSAIRPEMNSFKYKHNTTVKCKG